MGDRGLSLGLGQGGAFALSGAERREGAGSAVDFPIDGDSAALENADEIVVQAPGVDVYDERLGGLAEKAQELLCERVRSVDVLGVGARGIGREIVEPRRDRDRRDEK